MDLFKKITLTIILIIGCWFCYAQQISILGGVNLSQFRQQLNGEFGPKDGQTYSVGFNAGPVIDLYLKNIFSLETGMLFSIKGNKLTGSNNNLWEENMYFLELPIMLKASLPINKNANVFVMAGGYVVEALYDNRKDYGGKVDIKLEDKDYEFDRMDYGPKFGAGFKIKRYQLGACYEIGLKDFWNNNTAAYKNRVLELYMAYQLKEWNQKKRDQKKRNHFEKRISYPVSTSDGGTPKKR